MNPTLIVPRYIWGALLFTQFLFLYVLRTMGPNWAARGMTAPENTAVFGQVFPVMAVISLALAFGLRGFFLKAARARLQAVENPDLPKLMGSYFVPMIVAMALLESVTLYGFLLSMLTYDAERIYPYLGVAVLGMLWLYPSEDRIRKSLQ